MSGPNKPSEIQSPVLSPTKDKSPRNKPLLDKTLKQESISEALKKSLATREKVRAEYMRTMREKIQSENFAGKESIQVIPDKSDSTVIYIQTSQATLQVDLHYDESLETTDSLRKDSPTYPTNVSLTGTVEGELYTLNELNIEESVFIGSELLKHIERKQNPKLFVFRTIIYAITPLKSPEGVESEEITVSGIRENGKVEKIPFFEELEIHERKMLYGYISHYFGNKLPDDFFQKDITPQKPFQPKEFNKEA